MENLNPVWSLGVLGGGLFIFQLSSATSLRAAARALLWLGLVLPAPVLLLQPEFFWTRSEEISWVLKEVDEMRAGDIGTLFSIAPMIFVALLLLAGTARHAMIMPFLAASLVSAFYLWQIRWLPAALMAPVIALAAAFVVRKRGWIVRVASLALAVQSIWYAAAATRTGLENISNPKGAPQMYNVAMFSAMAARMAKEQGETKVLSSPNMTSTMFFAEGTRGIGSVYWESRPNLRFASKIFGSVPQTDEEARSLLKKHDIKMLAITPQVLDTAYIGLAGNWSRMDETLVVRLIKGEVPSWLEVVARVNQPWPGLGLYKVAD
jgi:hypothetical protein